jgi:hypothetical protein
MINENDDFFSSMFGDAKAQTTEEPTEIEQENEETPVNEEPQSPSEPPQEPSEEVDDKLQAYIDFLQQNELVDIPEEFDFKGTPDQLQQVFQYTKQKRQQEALETIFNSLPDDFKPVLEYVANGGNSVVDFMNMYTQDPLATVDISTTEGQRRAVYLALRETSNYPDEKINKIVSRIAEDEDELASEAAESYRELLSLQEQKKYGMIQEAKIQQERQKQMMEQKTQALYSAIDSSQTIHPQRRNKIKAFFFEPVNTQEGVTTGFNYAINSILQNPEHQAQLADLLLEYDPSSGFSSDRLEKRVKTKATQQFQTLLSKAIDPKQVQKSSTRPQSSKDFDWDVFNQSM